MKRKVLCSLALSGLLATGIAFAQDTPPDQNAPQAEGGGMGGHHRGGMRMMDPDQRLAHMTKRYNLTADQQSQIKPILQDEQQQMEAMRSDTTSSREDKRTKMMSMHETDNQKIEAVLNDEQKQKFEADQKKMQERRAEHMHGGGQGAGEAGQPPAQPQ